MTDTTTTTTTTEAPTKPVLGTPEYDQAMRDRFARGTAREDVAPDLVTKPEGVPDKFWNAEKGAVDFDGLLQSYTELEKKLGAPKETTTTTEPKVDDKPAETKTDDKPEEKTPEEKVAEAAGLNWTELETAIQTTGKLTDEQVEAIVKTGIPKEIVESHVAALTMAREYALERTEKHVGGKKNLDFIMEQASSKLTPAEIEEYDKQLASPNWRIALDALKAKFLPNADDAFGDSGDLFAGVQGSPGGGVLPFTDPSELSRAINERLPDGKRKYDVDARYRAQVQARLAITKRK